MTEYENSWCQVAAKVRQNFSCIETKYFLIHTRKSIVGAILLSILNGYGDMHLLIPFNIRFQLWDHWWPLHLISWFVLSDMSGNTIFCMYIKNSLAICHDTSHQCLLFIMLKLVPVTKSESFDRTGRNLPLAIVHQWTWIHYRTLKSSMALKTFAAANSVDHNLVNLVFISSRLLHLIFNVSYYLSDTQLHCKWGSSSMSLNTSWLVAIVMAYT